MNFSKLNAPELNFHPSLQKFVERDVFLPKITSFFGARDIPKFIPLKGNNCVTDLNFKYIGIKYFYNKLIKRLRNESDFDTKYFSITFDKQMAVLYCDKTKLFYNELCLGKKPILYIIYFDIQEISDAVRVYANKLKRSKYSKIN